MNSLVQFSFQYNCTYDVLKGFDICFRIVSEKKKHLLSGLQSARSTLKILDIEHSLLVTDECLPLLLKFSKLSSLAMSKTKLSTESQAEIIKFLTNLYVLPRGDYLCDALGTIISKILSTWKMHRLFLSEVIYWETTDQPPFKICNFWASEVYFFHSTEQMLLASKLCPQIQDMLFMFQVCCQPVISKIV